MKNIIFIFLLCFYRFSVYAQFFENPILDSLEHLAVKEIPKSYSYINPLKMNGHIRKKNEYACVFSRQTTYHFNIKSADGQVENILINIYDSANKIVASNYKNQQFREIFYFRCSKTGLYKVHCFFKNDKKCLALFTISYKHKNEEN